MAGFETNDRRHTARSSGVVDLRTLSAPREQRDPRYATQPRTFVNTNMPMEPIWNADTAIQRGYYANIFVYRCVQVTAQAIANMPIRVGADPAKPQSYRTDGVFAQLLSPPPGGPNATTSAKKLIAWSIAQKMVCGRLAWEYDLTPNGDIVGLWPMPAPRLKPVPSASGARYFDSFIWTDTSGQWRTLSPEEVYYAWTPSADDWREPESPLQSARLDVSTHIMQNRYDYAFLRNGGMPAAMVIGPFISDGAEREAFERQYSGSYQGVDQAGKTAFAYSDTPSLLDSTGNKIPAWDVKVLGLSQRDQQALERQRDVADRICAAFGTPMSKVGDSSGRTFSNAQQEDINWHREVVIPGAGDFADEINLLLAPRLGSDVCWFDTSTVDALFAEKQWTAVPITDLYDRGIANAEWVADEVGIPRDQMGTPVDPNEQAVAQKELAQSGAGPTPKRESIDLSTDGEPMAAGREFLDELRVAGKKVTPGDEAGTARLHKYWVAGPGLAKWRGDPHPWTALYHHLREYIHPDDFAKRTAATWFHEVFGIWPGTKHAKAGDETFAMPVAEIFEQRRAKAWHDTDMRTAALEVMWETEMRALFAKQRDATLSRLEGKRGKVATRAATSSESAPDAAAIYTADHWQQQTASIAANLYRSVATIAGTTAADKLGQAFNLRAPRIAQFIRDRASTFAKQITDTTYGQIREQLNAGAQAGESIPQLAKRIRHLFQVASDSRAKMIARTEVISAYNGASDAVVRDYGPDVVGGKEWIATRDARTREDHRVADGQVKAMHEPFVVGGAPMTYPGDPVAPPGEVINCRCTIGYLTPEEMANRGHAVRSTQLTPHEARALFRLIQGGSDAQAV